jgi:uncharacterized protein related to proFAR isomerase
VNEDVKIMEEGEVGRSVDVKDGGMEKEGEREWTERVRRILLAQPLNPLVMLDWGVLSKRRD